MIDKWFEKKVKPKMAGRAMLIRYADDFVVAFQFKDDAERFYRVLPKRLKKFGLDVVPDKTHLKSFSRFHPGRERNFQFLGFEYYWDIDPKGEPRLRQRTAPKKQKSALNDFYQWIKANRSKPLWELITTLKRKRIGFRNYFGLPDNSRSLSQLYYHVIGSLYKWLNRRSQRRSYNWSSFQDMLGYFQVVPMRSK